MTRVTSLSTGAWMTIEATRIENDVRELPELLPSDKGLPVLGRALVYAKDPVALMHHQWETYGAVTPLNALGEIGVMVLGPDACAEVLQNKDKAFANGPAGARSSARSSTAA